MGQISVTINDHNYSLACRDGEEERLQGLAELVKEKVDSLVATLGQVGENRLMLMAALLVSDELLEANEYIDKLESGDNKAVKEAAQRQVDKFAESATQRIEKIAALIEAH